jgi:hypothetical protein
VNVLISALIEALYLYQEHKSGNIDPDTLASSNKRFLLALDQYIDYRIKLEMESRRRAMSQERIAVSDSINSSIKSTASIIKSISALNSAPPPPTDISDIQQWMEEYTEWYENKRKVAISIE